MPSDIPWSIGSCDSDGESIYYEVSGPPDADVLVLGHGAGGNRTVWFQQVPHFARTYRVVTWDQRGFGASTNRNDDANPRSAARDLVRILDAVGAPRAHVVGQSMGGWAAMGATLAAPERVRSLVIADSLAGISVREWLERVGLPRRPQPVVGYHPALSDRFAEQHPDRAFLYQQIGRSGLAADEQPPASATLGLSEVLFTDEQVAAIGCPVLFVVGADDDIFPPDWIERTSAKVPGARVEVIADAGHSPYFEQPERWNAVVGDFLQRAS
ncbi:MAG TPA: alpha/beta fold hydrolase [Mycobacteriales bacterium]|jgi:pimeloyl-ACP methyl ester carboxylesterase|nr:alpha/beta fold hydrolase [Mycobacteriales bacterium]